MEDYHITGIAKRNKENVSITAKNEFIKKYIKLLIMPLKLIILHFQNLMPRLI